MNTVIARPKVYTDIGAAQRDAQELRDGELDGWTYRVQQRGFAADPSLALYVIEASDESGVFVGYLGRGA